MKKIDHAAEPNYSASYNAGILQGKAYKTFQLYLSRSLQPYNISIPEWKLLGQLYDHNELRVLELASLLGYDPPLVTSLIDSLEKKHLIRKKTNHRDKRVKHIVPTLRTKRLIVSIEPQVKSEITALFAGLSHEEFLTYIKVLKIVVANGKEFS